jgi:hypothetical protein
MINLPLNFSAPTGQVQNTYATPARTNPYLTPSQYAGMQLHAPSGYYYQGDKFYEPYTVGTKTVTTQRANSFGNVGGAFGNSPMSSQLNRNPLYGGMGNFGGFNRTSTVPDIIEGSIQSGNQYFKPFTGNAQGIINGNLSMVGQTPQYQAQGIPANLLSFLSAPNIQQTTNQQSSGAGRFSGLLGSPITTNAQGK